MILLDPDLDPSLAPASKAAKQTSAATAQPAIERTHRLPTLPTLARFLALAQSAVRLKGQVSVLLTSDAAIRKLNRQFRFKNKATDVLSFPSEPFPGLPASEQMAGDLAISVPTALRQAVGQGHSLSTEVKVLMLHGLLHLSGLDHETDTGQMARKERLLRAKLGLPQGLIERTEAPKPSIPKLVPAKKRVPPVPILGPGKAQKKKLAAPSLRVPHVPLLGHGKTKTKRATATPKKVGPTAGGR